MHDMGGYGVIAEKSFPKGFFVCEYSGDLISIEAARERENAYIEVCHSLYVHALSRPLLDYISLLFEGVLLFDKSLVIIYIRSIIVMTSIGRCACALQLLPGMMHTRVVDYPRHCWCVVWNTCG